MRVITYAKLLFCLVVASFVCLPVTSVYACSTGVQSCSPGYQVDQTFFGSGGDLNDSSTNYRAKTTAGELGIGNTASANYQAFVGFNTTDAPYLEFVVTGSNIDLGYLKTTQASTATGTFYVRAWQSSGYVVQTAANPPTNIGSGAHQLAPMTAGGVSTPGTEQFGINLVKNTNFCGAGCDLGADIVQNNAFSVGSVAAGYATPNNFKYNKGDVIAQATKSSSVTVYTISYLFNIAPNTPAGQYNFSHTLVATATY